MSLNMPVILALDDDKRFLENIQFSFEGTFRVLASETIEEAEKLFRSHRFDALILDYHLGLGKTGHCFVDQVRAQNLELPIVVVSGVVNLDMAMGFLKRGVDGFLEKPVRLSELKDLLVNVLAKDGKNQNPAHSFQIDYPTKKAFYQGRQIILTPTEFEILYFFVRNSQRQVSRQELVSHLWGDMQVSRHTFDTHLLNLKRKLPPFAERLTSVYGRGYCYEA